MLAGVFGRRDVVEPAKPCGANATTVEVLRTLAAILASAEGAAAQDPIVAQLTRHAEVLAQTEDCQHTTALADAIRQTCGAVVTAAQRRQQARRDVAATLTRVRLSVDALAVNQVTARTALTASTARLERLQRLGSLAEMKRDLRDEVETLRTMATTGERAHRNEIAALAERLTAAEGQLSLTGQAALIDPLTQVTSRRGFDLALEHRLEEFEPTTSMMLALFDVNGLQAINERFGQEAGDAALKHVARTIRTTVRPQDVVARIGGDEFAVIASGMTLHLAETRLRQVVQAVADGRLGVTGEPISIRCGAAEVSAGDSVLTLMHRATQALTEARALAHHRVVTRDAPLIRTLMAPKPHRWGT